MLENLSMQPVKTVIPTKYFNDSVNFLLPYLRKTNKILHTIPSGASISTLRHSSILKYLLLSKVISNLETFWIYAFLDQTIDVSSYTFYIYQQLSV